MEQAATSRSVESKDIPRDAITIGQLVARIKADSGIPLKKRGDICSGVRSLCRVLGLPPDSTLADPRLIAERLAEVTPAAARMSKGRLQNCRSHMDAALAYADKTFQRRRTTVELAPEYLELSSKASDRWEANRLRRLFHFASRRGVSPSGIDDQLFDDFLKDLERSTIPDFRTLDRETRKTWNAFVENLADPEFKTVTIPTYVDHYVLSVDEFPKSLWDDLEKYLAFRRKMAEATIDDLLTEEELFDDDECSMRHTPIRESTAALIRYRVRQFASALVLDRVKPARQILALADLVAPLTVRDGLRFFIRRAGGHQRKSQIRGMASDLLMIARLWVRSSEADLKKLGKLAELVRPKHEGLPESARRSLAPFRDLSNVQAFLALPERVVRDAERRSRIDRATANRVAAALWIKIAQRVPLRISQLLKTDVSANIVRSHSGKSAAVALLYAPEDAKNDKALEAPLPPSVVKLLDLYLTKYRLFLVDGPNGFLFPGSKDGRKRSSVMSEAIQTVMRNYIGFSINPHSFRHVAAKLYLSVHPGNYERVQQLLGHRNRETTVKYYVDLEAEDAFRHFDAVLLGLEESGNSQGRRR